MPAGLVESELFGHEKGAFSGAISKRLGRFELADGGTLFLDEIGELPPEAQAKILRVLQEREFDRVGGAAPIRVDVRVLAATNRNLESDVQDKKFRGDLFYRLNVFPIRLPALRERREDIPLLVQHLVTKFALRIGKRIKGVSGETLHRLTEYSWPGNIRELENVLERAVILASGDVLEIGADLLPVWTASAEVRPAAEPPAAAPAAAPAAVGGASLEAVERNHILAVLQQTNWIITGPRGAARILNLPPSTLRNRMKKLGVERTPHQIW
jgi:transcriptional regulator with GAF, ATPase, and Fis domain